jgi:hypothetical protein
MQTDKYKGRETDEQIDRQSGTEEAGRQAHWLDKQIRMHTDSDCMEMKTASEQRHGIMTPYIL